MWLDLFFFKPSYQSLWVKVSKLSFILSIEPFLHFSNINSRLKCFSINLTLIFMFWVFMLWACSFLKQISCSKHPLYSFRLSKGGKKMVSVWSRIPKIVSLTIIFDEQKFPYDSASLGQSGPSPSSSNFYPYGLCTPPQPTHSVGLPLASPYFPINPSLARRHWPSPAPRFPLLLPTVHSTSPLLMLQPKTYQLETLFLPLDQKII